MRPDTGDPMNFYTNVTRHRNQILVRGISDGKPVKFSVKYKPYLFVQASAQTEHKNLKGELGEAYALSDKAERDLAEAKSKAELEAAKKRAEAAKEFAAVGGGQE